MKALVSIITVNYNGLRDTCEMIDSFRNHETYPHYEIIVVDNGSRLPEAEEIQERYRGNLVPGGSLSGSPASDNPVPFPPVKVVRNINNGFAGRQQCRTENRRRRLSLFHQQRHAHQRTGTGGVGTTHGVRPATQRRRIAHVEIRRLSGHPAICRLHSSKFPYTAQRIHRIHATGRPALPYSLRNRLIARSRHDGKPAGATGCRPHERNIFPFLRRAGLVCTA